MLFLQNMMVNGDAFFSATRWRLLGSARALCGTTAGVGPFGYGISCVRHNRLVLGNSAHVCLLPQPATKRCHHTHYKVRRGLPTRFSCAPTGAVTAALQGG